MACASVSCVGDGALDVPFLPVGDGALDVPFLPVGADALGGPLILYYSMSDGKEQPSLGARERQHYTAVFGGGAG